MLARNPPKWGQAFQPVFSTSCVNVAPPKCRIIAEVEPSALARQRQCGRAQVSAESAHPPMGNQFLFAGESRRIGNRSADMGDFERGIRLDDLLASSPFGQRIENHGHRHARPFRAKLPADNVTAHNQVFPPVDHGGYHP